VAFAVGSTVLDGYAAVPVTAGSATCDASFATEVAGDVVATYSGTDALKGAASEAKPFAVAKTATTTSLIVSETEPVTGQLVQLLARVTETGGEPVGTGKVAFTSAGTPIPGCGSVTVSDDGYASCSTSWSARGTYAVTAAYGGTAQ